MRPPCPGRGHPPGNRPPDQITVAYGPGVSTTRRPVPRARDGGTGHRGCPGMHFLRTIRQGGGARRADGGPGYASTPHNPPGWSTVPTAGYAKHPHNPAGVCNYSAQSAQVGGPTAAPRRGTATPSRPAAVTVLACPSRRTGCTSPATGRTTSSRGS